MQRTNAGFAANPNFHIVFKARDGSMRLSESSIRRRPLRWRKGTKREKAEAVFECIGANIKTDGPHGTRWGVKKVLNQGFAHCWDFSDVFVTMCRADVLTRQVAGRLHGSAGHVWAEYWIEGRGRPQIGVIEPKF